MAYSRLMNFTLGATRKSTKETENTSATTMKELQNIGNLGILNIKADPEPPKRNGWNLTPHFLVLLLPSMDFKMHETS
ncbi:MAG: hypothetical protein IPK58_23775 [Acidobacteria bacterium]|nr:hypothetical protein [Acidobacteriota bacterium]